MNSLLCCYDASQMTTSMSRVQFIFYCVPVLSLISVVIDPEVDEAAYQQEMYSIRMAMQLWNRRGLAISPFFTRGSANETTANFRWVELNWNCNMNIFLVIWDASQWQKLLFNLFHAHSKKEETVCLLHRTPTHVNGSPSLPMWCHSNCLLIKLESICTHPHTIVMLISST